MKKNNVHQLFHCFFIKKRGLNQGQEGKIHGMQRREREGKREGQGISCNVNLNAHAKFVIKLAVLDYPCHSMKGLR